MTGQATKTDKGGLVWPARSSDQVRLITGRLRRAISIGLYCQSWKEYLIENKVCCRYQDNGKKVYSHLGGERRCAPACCRCIHSISIKDSHFHDPYSQDPKGS